MNQILGNTIARLRKERGMTQEQLANELNISYQAVSKWENGVSSPDLSNIKRLSELFGISIDELFGLTTRPEEHELPQIVSHSYVEQKTPEDPMETQDAADAQETVAKTDYCTQKLFELPWEDDDMLRVVAFRGKSLLSATEVSKRFFTRNNIVIEYRADVQNIYSLFNISCEKVYGNIEADGSVTCQDVLGHINAGGHVNCGRVEGSVQAGGDVDADMIGCDVRAGGDVDCSAIGGNVTAGGDVDCGDVGGNVTAGRDVDCGTVIGNVNAQGDVDCGKVGGSVTHG